MLVDDFILFISEICHEYFITCTLLFVYHIKYFFTDVLCYSQSLIFNLALPCTTIIQYEMISTDSFGA